MGAVCTARDLSELRNAEAVARERQSLLKNILRARAKPSTHSTLDGNYKWCNQAMLDLTGIRMREFIGRNFLERVHEEDRQMRRERFAATAGRRAAKIRIALRRPRRRGPLRAG